jgi:hypothetical protein
MTEYLTDLSSRALAAVAALFVLAACGAADEPAAGNCELLTNAIRRRSAYRSCRARRAPSPQ